MKLSKILTIITVVLALVLGMTSCDFLEGIFPSGDDHVCESICGECGLCTDAECTEDACKDKCQGHEQTPGHVCESKCDECGKCTDAACTESVCADKCQGHQTEATTPVISVIPPEVEINAGDDIDLMFGVSVTDEGDPDVRVIIEDDNDFDATVEGEYTITYKAINKFGNEATATRKVTVLPALSALNLEVRKNLLGENKWVGNILGFENKLYVTLTGDKVYDVAVSGVFYNSSSESIVLSIAGGYGVAGIIDANGVVIEGRDGANGKVVNAANPTRTGSGLSTVVVNGENVSVVEAFAQNLVIPAGGYAIVVQNGYCGTTVDNDGRGFMNYNVIYQVGNVVRLVWADSAEVLTPYVDQAPTISGNGTISYAALNDANFSLDVGALDGVTATDDNGTFATDDDVTITVTIADNGGFAIGTAGKYNVILTATDGTNTATAVRVVEVTANLAEITVGENSYQTLPENVVVDVNISKLGSYHFIIYTPNFTDTELNFVNGWGEAFILNEYGIIVRIYDGANGKYYDADNQGGITDATLCTAADYLKQAFASRQPGEYLVVAPNGTAGNVSRAFFLANRTIGAKVTLPGVSFKHFCESVCVQCGKCLDADCTDTACAEKCEGHVHNCSALCEVCVKCQNTECDDPACAAKCDCVTVTINGKSLKVAAGTIAIDVAAPAVGSYNFIIYTYAFKAENETLSWNNGWSEALIINEYGQVVRVYDGVSGGKYFDAANRAGIVDASITTAANTLKDAYASLSEGEILILGANGGMNGNAGRGFLGGVRVVGALATIPGVEFKALPEHACESACADCGKCMDPTCIMPACLGQCACHRCESICSKCNGCLDPACTEKACATKCSCHDCESLCNICGGCKDTVCDNEVCAKKCVCDIESDTVKYFAINSSYFMAPEGKWLYNTVCGNTTEPKAQNYKMIIFDKSYTGTFTTNSYGVAVVVDANGTLIKGYAWDGYYTAEGKTAIHYAVGDYATTAFNELKAGEVLIIFPNDGVNAADSARTFGKGLCDNWAATMGKKVVITGFTFDGVVVHACESKCPACGLCLDAECTESVCAEKCQGHAHICESACATCGKCLDKECTEEACAVKCNCLTVQIGSKVYTAVDGKWAINSEITTATAASKAVWIFDKSYTGEFSTNGYGVAVILDQFGKVIRVYDGANGGYWLPDGKQASAHFNTSTYATVAWSELQAGETLVLLPNGGSDGNAARQIGLDCRYLFNQKMNITGVSFKSPTKTITIGSKTYTAAEGKWIYNGEVTTSTAANYAIVILDKNYTGEFNTNGYGVAVVLDAQGRVIRVYDGANGGYWLPDGKQASAHFNANTYATVAWSELKEGETLVVLPNGGSEGNAARQIGLDCRYLFNQKMSITDMTFAE